MVAVCPTLEMIELADAIRYVHACSGIAGNHGKVLRSEQVDVVF